ncbi:hypothetical protein [Capillimicrobium parvum]|uniref:Uncharacterized protein n=1 Tax=Capillimicrobium parvum TaxID=2884022 RepID=A0A9E6XYL7_9ACTN|nr:hypothetical protein [Capillimicrobium parvum]UGS37022.1 hypothetical protein DSM104329_03434 [Capillimicrobium parvum]
MKTYLEGEEEEEALDAFEFLAMAAAAELGHWEIVQQMATMTGAAGVRGLGAAGPPVLSRRRRQAP